MAKSKKAPKNAKNTIPILPNWRRTKGFVYQSVDPVSGGIWQFVGSKETDQDTLNQRVMFLVLLCGTERPQRDKLRRCIPLTRDEQC
jgi:hypothetical protein